MVIIAMLQLDDVLKADVKDGATTWNAGLEAGTSVCALLSAAMGCSEGEVRERFTTVSVSRAARIPTVADLEARFARDVASAVECIADYAMRTRGPVSAPVRFRGSDVACPAVVSAAVDQFVAAGWTAVCAEDKDFDACWSLTPPSRGDKEGGAK